MTLQEAIAPFISHSLLVCLSKKSFETRERAVGYGRGRDGFRLFVYRCPHCDGWHLTKKLQRR